MNGVFLNEGEQVGVVDPETGTSSSTCSKTSEQFPPPRSSERSPRPTPTARSSRSSRSTPKHEDQYDRFPKTLIFAANDLPHTSHADQLVDLARDIFGRGDSFVQKITGSSRPPAAAHPRVPQPQPGHRRDGRSAHHRRRYPGPGIHRLLRPVKSRILFEQMLGRGTRKGEQFPDKSHFVVFDCFDGTLLEYFRNPPASRPSRPRPSHERSRDHRGDLGQPGPRLQRPLPRQAPAAHRQGMAGEAASCSRVHIPDGDLGQFASELPQTLRKRFHRDDGPAAQCGLSEATRRLPAQAQDVSSWPRTKDEVTSTVADP